jgi:hypothetical protein
VLRIEKWREFINISMKRLFVLIMLIACLTTCESYETRQYRKNIQYQESIGLDELIWFIEANPNLEK